jgi:hypothetical protein
MGRQKGARNKHHGLARSYHQVSGAIAQLQKGTLDAESLQTLRDLKALLQTTELPAAAAQRLSVTTEKVSISPSRSSSEDSYVESVLEDVENPLELLAQASRLYSRINTFQLVAARPVPEQSFAPPPWTMSSLTSSLDVGPYLDPIDLGILAEQEAVLLLDYFYTHLSHARWGLDPSLFTVPYLRQRSAFLLTSLLASSAKFLPGNAVLSDRLSSHVQLLTKHVVNENLRSVEIVIALLVNVPWAPVISGVLSEDVACFNVALALKIALDLNLNRPVTFQTQDHRMDRGGMTAAKALVIDGHPDLNPDSGHARILLRQRERTWIALFVLERGVCLARGRDFTVPISPLVRECEAWSRAEDACRWDVSMCSIAALRRDLENLLNELKDICNAASGAGRDEGRRAAYQINELIDHFFRDWRDEWSVLLLEEGSGAIPPYANILVTHTRLSTYGSVINHRAAPTEIKGLFRNDGMQAAVEVMRTAVRAEKGLTAMPNNTAIMVAYAACVALSLSKAVTERDPAFAVGIWNMVEETAGVLERIAQVTPQRRGFSRMYGQCLRKILDNIRGASNNSGGTTNAHLRTDDAEAMTAIRGPMYLPDDRPSLEYFAQPDHELYSMINDVMTGNADVLAHQPFEDFSDINWLQPDYNSNMQYPYMQ